METIESFVAKLKADGVEAGKQEAEKLQADAKTHADRILADAKAQAEKALADAQADADALLQRGKTELSLAARDASLKLQEALTRALQKLVDQSVDKPLSDPALLGGILQEIVLKYVDQLRAGSGAMEVDVPESLQARLSELVFQQLGQAGLDDANKLVDIKGTLAGAGFEYTVNGATVEVTQESVTQVFSEMLSPALRELLTQAAEAGTGG